MQSNRIKPLMFTAGSCALLCFFFVPYLVSMSMIQRNILPPRVLNHRVERDPKAMRQPEDTENRDLSRRVIIHMFWSSVDGTLNEKVKTSLRSALRTQHRTRLILWTTPDSLRGLTAQIERISTLQCPSTLELKSTDELIDLTEKDSKTMRSCVDSLRRASHDLVAFSDLIRFLALYYFGGIYADADMIFLKDLQNFQGVSFAYKWDRNVQFYNTALMGLTKGNELVPQIISRAGECSPAAFYPTRIHEKLSCSSGVCNELIMMPTALFSPVSAPQSNYQWQEDSAHSLGTTTDWFFQRPRLWGLDHFFPGAHTFHWHNRWEMSVHNDSFFSHLQRLNSVCHC